MSFLATALRAYSGVGEIEAYRKSWRILDSKGRNIGNNNMLIISGLKERLSLLNLDTGHKAHYALTLGDAMANDWVVKTKSVSVSGISDQPFFFLYQFHKQLTQNRLITLSDWGEEKFICITAAELNGAFGVVHYNGPTFVSHSDWYPTPVELLDLNWYALDRYAPITIDKELSTSFLDYSMSVITARALPDARDGFKPVHRRCIFAQHVLGNTKQGAYKKSARVVGDVIGKYHPHGDCKFADAVFYCLDGKNRTIGEVYESGIKELDVLAYDELTQNIVPAKAHSFRIGQYADKVYRLELSDGSVFRVTSNDPIYVEQRGWVAAEHMYRHDILMAGSIYVRPDNGYHILNSWYQPSEFIHHVTCPVKPKVGEVRHHLNHNKLDNRPSNLEVISRAEHAIHHDDYLKGLNAGRVTMESDERWLEARKLKNSELMKAYNRALPIIKALKHIGQMQTDGIPLTALNYHLRAKDRKIYNVTKLTTLFNNYDLTWDGLVDLFHKGYAIDTSKAIGFTMGLKPVEESLELSSNGIRALTLNRVGIVVRDMLEFDAELTWEAYSFFNSRKDTQDYQAVGVDRVREIIGVDTFDDLLKALADIGYLLFVKDIALEQVDQEPMYDFTVDGLANALFLTRNEVSSPFLIAHNSAVYESIVRLAQPFSMRYPLVDGQGNFGSVDGDSAAAMRYTEVRMETITAHMLSDLPKNTVDWVDNYDGSEQIPDVLPTRFPNLVVNGNSGIAVGMATNMPPHNMTEVMNAVVAMIRNPNISDDELFSIIPAPDFPTGGMIRGLTGARKAMRTGKGRVVITSKFHMEKRTNGIIDIVFTEIPYAVKKSSIMQKIADQVSNKKLEGISNIQDESDREGMRIVVTCRRDANPDVVLNNLLGPDIGLEVGFSVNNMAIVDGLPRLLTMRDMLNIFIRFRQEIVIRRTHFEIEELRKRAHLLEGQIAALMNIDVIIDTIKKSPDTATAIQNLCRLAFNGKDIRKVLGSYDRIDQDPTAGYSADDKKYVLHPDQARDIVNMRLARLTGLEKNKVQMEFMEIIKNIFYLWTIINDVNVLNGVIIEESIAAIPINDKRRTVIDLKEHRVATIEELTPDQPIVITMSRRGWIKKQDLNEYKAQCRGGRGKTAASLKDDDYIRLMVTASEHQNIMLLTTFGRIHCVKGYELPGGGRGKPVQNHIVLQEGEEVTTVIPIREFGANEYMVIATRQGKIKRTSLDQFTNIRTAGIIAIDLKDGDTVIGCKITNGNSEIMLFSSDSKAIRFEEQQVRAMGRHAGGIAGIGLSEGAFVCSLVTASLDDDVLCVCANGYGKRTPVAEFTKHNRGGKGVISINASKRNGHFVAAAAVESGSEIMICSDDGIAIRFDSKTVAETARNAQGVKLINLEPGAHVSAVETIKVLDEALEKAKPLVKKKRITK